MVCMHGLLNVSRIKTSSSEQRRDAEEREYNRVTAPSGGDQDVVFAPRAPSQGSRETNGCQDGNKNRAKTSARSSRLMRLTSTGDVL